MPVKRRDFLKIGGGISLSTALNSCVSRRTYDSTSKSNWLGAVEHWVPTVCKACPGGCGILVRKIDDRAVKIEGNPLHPMNKGRVCPKGQAGLQLLYSPDRIRAPLKKVGNRDSGKWETLNWEEALQTVTSRLLQLRNAGKSHTVIYLSQNSNDSSDDLIKRFLRVYGTPNYLAIDDWAALKKAYHLTQGVYDVLALDLENAKYVLSFGADFLTNWPNLMENQRTFGEKRAKRDIKIVQVEPRFSLEASRADDWIPITPGTEGLLALGIASVIIKERLYNEIFINKFTMFFEDWIDEKEKRKIGFKNSILRDIRLDHISDLTGVPLRTIIEIAKEFSANKPALAVADCNLSFHEKGFFNILAVQFLNALVGNIDSPGGILRQRKAPLTEMPPVALDDSAKKALSQERIDKTQGHGLAFEALNIENFIKSALNQAPYEINCLILSKSLPGFFFQGLKRTKEIQKNIPFIVSFSPFLDEQSSLADIILPDATYFEKWQDGHVSSLSKIPVVGIGRPVIKPLYQSKPFEDILLTLTKRMGPDLSQNFPWSSYKELLLDRMKGLFMAKRGSVFATPYEEAQLRLLEERGWWIPQHDSLDAFMKDLLNKGGWQDPSYHFNERSYIYQSPSRKFEFFPSLQPQDLKTQFSGNSSEYPFHLYLYDLPYSSEDSGANMPWFQETLGFRFNLLWKTWVEINPDTAKELEIHDKDLIYVESPFGKVEGIAKVFPGIKPQIIGIPVNKKENVLGQGEKKNNNPLTLLGETYDEQTGMLSWHSTKVKIYKP